jgi:hypothetical protein
VYEGYGAGGAALLIEATTDNRNRIVAGVRATLTAGVAHQRRAGRQLRIARRDRLQPDGQTEPR